MPDINAYRCDTCGFAFPSGWGGYMYVLTDDGSRLPCPHPAEYHKAFKVLAHRFSESFRATADVIWLSFLLNLKGPEALDPPDREILLNGIGFNSNCICTSCMHQFEADVGDEKENPWRAYYHAQRPRDPRICPQCGARTVQTVFESIDKPCPSCKKGTIKEIETGWVT